jgi:uncharacterized damage-inducible protein DinB
MTRFGEGRVSGERDDLLEHLERYRAVTLQHLDLCTDAELTWRPRPDAFTVWQHFVHIWQSEDFYVRGLFDADWDMARLRFPSTVPSRQALEQQFEAVRSLTRKHLAQVAGDGLSVVVSPPHAGGIEASMRSWLWFVLEHEIHHKAQLAEYLRALGRVPPYFAIPLPSGVRPDIDARTALGGV